jgi:prolyl-tRNA synthetase
MLFAGAYTYLPLGLRALDNIQAVIREEMASCAASELLMPALQPLEIWQRTGRDKDIGEVMIRFTDRRGRKVCLGPTHEEIITELVKSHVSSYKQLPAVLYQIQTKFRDEIRPRFGLIRACEFIMKDAYSFDKDEAGLDKNYQAMFQAYQRIFSRCGLKILTTEADSGVMGGKVSHEFMVPARDGEDVVLVCPSCKATKTFKEGDKADCAKCGKPADKVNCIEVGHIFKLGTKYTSILGANFLDAQGKLNPIIMGCYGIGVSRLISAIIEQNNDEVGIIWPKEIAPYKVAILPLDVNDSKIMEVAGLAYKELCDKGIEPLFDDRDERAGVKFKDADLIGIPVQVTVGQKALAQDKIEVKSRTDKQGALIDRKDLADHIVKVLA